MTGDIFSLLVVVYLGNLGSFTLPICFGVYCIVCIVIDACGFGG